MSTTEKSALHRAGMQIVAGGTAGFVEICLMHPLDIAKTRLQMQSSANPIVSGANHYRGVLDCFGKMYKQEGLQSYYKGILPPILVETPKTAVRFFTFEQSKRLFLFGESQPTPLVSLTWMRSPPKFINKPHLDLCSCRIHCWNCGSFPDQSFRSGESDIANQQDQDKSSTWNMASDQRDYR